MLTFLQQFHKLFAIQAIFVRLDLAFDQVPIEIEHLQTVYLIRIIEIIASQTQIKNQVNHLKKKIARKLSNNEIGEKSKWTMYLMHTTLCVNKFQIEKKSLGLFKLKSKCTEKNFKINNWARAQKLT